MAEIAPARSNLLVEETQYRSAVSEALLQKTGASINFINNEQTIYRQFTLNGNYPLGAGIIGLDGLVVFRSNVEIIHISASNAISGSSGSTTFDLHYISSPGVDGGTIFNTKPSFDSTSANNSYFLYNVLTDTIEVSGIGITPPNALVKTTFLKGEALRFDLDSAMVGAENANLEIYFRPIN